jgi:5-methylcytosine-specific restriction endonuclease McrA
MASSDSTEELRQCKVCQEIKPLSAFGKSRGYHLWTCKACKDLYVKAWCAANVERLMATKKRWKQANPDKVHASSKTYHQRHQAERAAYNASRREETAIYNRAYREAHLEEKRAYDRAYNAAHQEELRAYRLANREKRLAAMHEWRAAHREEVSAYNKAWELAHKEERAAYAQAYVSEHAEEIAAKRKVYHAKNKDRNYARLKSIPGRIMEYSHTRIARKRNAPIDDLSAAQFEEIKQSQAYRCAYCGKKFASARLTPDHVTPYAHQGSNTLWNVVACCRSCNAKKNTKPPLGPVQPLLLSLAPKKRRRS